MRPQQHAGTHHSAVHLQRNGCRPQVAGAVRLDALVGGECGLPAPLCAAALQHAAQGRVGDSILVLVRGGRARVGQAWGWVGRVGTCVRWAAVPASMSTAAGARLGVGYDLFGRGRLCAC